jgi:hypothetical protein
MGSAGVNNCTTARVPTTAAATVAELVEDDDEETNMVGTQWKWFCVDHLRFFSHGYNV